MRRLRSDIDQKDFECIQQCTRDREEDQSIDNHAGGRRPPISANPADNDFGEFCERTRQILLVDCEVSALLVKLREGKLALGNSAECDQWHPKKWLDAIFRNVQTLQSGVTYMKCALEQPKRGKEREGIPGWPCHPGLAVADMLLHIGLIEPSPRTAHEADLEERSRDNALKRLQRFVDDTRRLDVAAIWSRAAASKDLAEDGMLIDTEELLTDIDKQLGYNSNFNEAAKALGYTYTSSTSEIDHEHGAAKQRLHEVSKFLQVVRTVRRYIATVDGTALVNGQWRVGAEVRVRNPATDKEEEATWTLERAVIVEDLSTKGQPDSVRLRWKGGQREEVVVPKKDLREPSVWEELMWSEEEDVGDFTCSSSDLRTVQTCVAAVKRHIQNRGAPLWRRWVRGKPFCFTYEQLAELNQGKVESSVVFPSKVQEGEDEVQSQRDLYNFCVCLQSMGYTGTHEELKPLFDKIVEWEKTPAEIMEWKKGASVASSLQTPDDVEGAELTTESQTGSQTGSKHGEWEWRRAVAILERSRNGVNYSIDDQLRWERNGRYQLRLRLIPWFCSRAYERAIALSCVVHICLAFFEAPSLPGGLSNEEEALERQDKLKWVALICVAIYWMDALMMLYWHGSRHGCKRPHRGLMRFPRRSHSTGWARAWGALNPSIPAGKSADEAKRERKEEWADRKFKAHQVAKVAILVSISFDFVAQYSSILHDWDLSILRTGYSTAPHGLNGPESGPWNVYLLLPYTAILRPCMLVLRSDSLRSGAADFFKTMRESTSIFLMCMLLLAFFSAFSVALFASTNHEQPDNAHLFEHVFRAITTWFTYMTTAANWPDVVWAPVNCAGDDGIYESGGCARWTFHTFFMLASIVVRSTDRRS